MHVIATLLALLDLEVCEELPEPLLRLLELGLAFFRRWKGNRLTERLLESPLCLVRQLLEISDVISRPSHVLAGACDPNVMNNTCDVALQSAFIKFSMS